MAEQQSPDRSDEGRTPGDASDDREAHDERDEAPESELSGVPGLHPVGHLVTQLRRRLRETYLPKLLSSRDKLFDKLEEVPERMQKLTNQVELVLELARDYQEGHYRKLPWYSLSIAVLALLYFISPTDVLPDYIPGLGALDDIFVLGVATRLLRRDLIEYCLHKGRDPADYF